MPLIKSSSDEAASKNIEEMRKAGYPEKQAVAAALHNQDDQKAKEKAHKAEGNS